MGSELLVVFPHHASFIDQDIRLLERKFGLECLEYRRPSDRFDLARRLSRTRVAIAWFVLGYAYTIVRLQRLLRYRSLLVAGGWDVESLPEYGYGEMRNPSRSKRTSYALDHADRVLAVSRFTLHRVLKWAPDARAEVLYHGFDSDRFSPASRRRQGVLTVARVSPDKWKLKGLTTLVEVARRLQSVPFVVVGDVSGAGSAVEGLPENVSLPGWLSQDDLIELYRQSKVYAQLSVVESFGCSLAEAMLCGCVPVVTARGALPEVVGPVGKRVPYDDVDATEEAIREALAQDDGREARERIQVQFSLEQRAHKLESEVRHLLEKR